MKILRKIDLFFNRLYYYLITILGILLIGVVFYGVLRRYLFNIPLIWGYEFSILLFMWIAFPGMAIGFQKNRHRSITFIVDGIRNEKHRKFVEIFLSVLITLILITCTITGFMVFIQMDTTSFRTINLSLGWQYLALPVSFATMSITSINNFFEIINDKSSRLEFNAV